MKVTAKEKQQTVDCIFETRKQKCFYPFASIERQNNINWCVRLARLSPEKSAELSNRNNAVNSVDNNGKALRNAFAAISQQWFLMRRRFMGNENCASKVIFTGHYAICERTQ
jgi:hypothetical protein